MFAPPATCAGFVGLMAIVTSSALVVEAASTRMFVNWQKRELERSREKKRIFFKLLNRTTSLFSFNYL